MKELKKYYLLLCFLCGGVTIGWSQAQLTFENSDAPIPEITSNFPAFSSTLSSFTKTAVIPDLQLVPPSTSCMLAPKAYNYHLLGAFCKLDVQLEKVVQMPVKFRLGTVNYVDKLEGKSKGPDY